MAPVARFRRSSQMRFMFIVKTAHTAPPTPKLIEAMHKLADREIKAGRMLDNGGLMPPATGAQGPVHAWQRSDVDGPVPEAQHGIFRLTRTGTPITVEAL